MQDVDVYVGIDVGRATHQVSMEDEEGTTHEWTMTHRHESFETLKDHLAEATDGDLTTIVVGVEGQNGHLMPLDRYLVEWGCEVRNVDARKLRSFRDTFGVPCKTDVEDARLLVHLLKQGTQLYKDGKPPYHRVQLAGMNRRKLKKWSRYQKTLIEEKTRMINRLTQRIHEVCPELLDVANLKGTRMLRMLKTYPDVRGLKQVTPDGLESIQQIGPKTAEQFHQALQDLEYDSAMVDVYTPMIEQMATRILELRQQIQQLDERIEKLSESIEAIGYLESIKGCATKTASRLLGEIGRVEWFDSHNELAAYLGVACVDHQSGDQDGAKPVYPSNTLGKECMMNLAGKMIQHDPESRRYYDKKRDEGKRHFDALRRVARQLVKIIYRMLAEQREYVPYSEHSQQSEGKQAA